MRWAAANISRVGPPPPSPQPNGSNEVVPAPFSAYWRSALANSRPEMSELYVSTGGKCVNTLVPSMPSHQKVWWGIRLVSFHEIFWVRNHFDPAAVTICGSAAE